MQEILNVETLKLIARALIVVGTIYGWSFIVAHAVSRGFGYKPSRTIVVNTEIKDMREIADLIVKLEESNADKREG